MKDFFVSYNGTDVAWAEWIAWTLEDADYTVEIQAWDFRPGQNFVLKMHDAITHTEKTVAVLTQNYLDASYTHPEWAAIFVDDPKGENRKLIPVRVAECEPQGLLKPITYVNLVGLSEDDARLALLGAFSDRGKPDKPPAFPGKTLSFRGGGELTVPRRATYPGTRTRANAPSASEILGARNQVVERSKKQHLQPSEEQRMAVVNRLNELLPERFNMLVFALAPPAGRVPAMPAPQASRALALLQWAESEQGCGSPAIIELTEMVVGSSAARRGGSRGRVPDKQ